MSDDRDKLLQIMNRLEEDYRSGKISQEKYSYFRSKYEDKLNSIDAVEATRRIRSMQGKPDNTSKSSGKRSSGPTKNKRKQEQDLVQKYIINPKKGDAKYNKKKKSSMDGNTFKLIAVLVLVIAFTSGVAYGVFSLDFDTGGDNAGVVAIVEDTAFPEINAVINTTVNNVTDNSNNTQVEDTNDDNQDVETTTETTTTTTTDTSTSESSQSSQGSSSNGGGSSDSGSSSEGSSDSGGGSSDSGGGSSDSGGGSSESGSSEGGEE